MTYLDTGCFVKLYYPEPDSARVIAALQGQPVYYTSLHELEFVNALHLKVFSQGATLAQVTAARALVEADIKSGVLVPAGRDWNDIFREAVILAEHHTHKLGCRSLDILHCAAAQLLAAPAFITTDVWQKKLAQALGLNLVPI